MDQENLATIRTGYDAVAAEYVAHLYHELDGKPFDRAWLDRLAATWKDRGTICDLGCGPGQVAHYLHQRGAQVIGIDLSPAMIEQARQLSPAIEFATGNMLELAVPAQSWSGIVAFYAIVNLPRPDLPTVFQQCHRVLQAGGWLLLSFHLGNKTVHRDEMWGKAVSLDFLFFERTEIETLLQQAGFEILESVEREPYPEVEYPSRRAYLLAQKPGS